MGNIIPSVSPVTSRTGRIGQREGSLKGSFVSAVGVTAGPDDPAADATVGGVVGVNVELDSDADERTMD